MHYLSKLINHYSPHSLRLQGYNLQFFIIFCSIQSRLQTATWEWNRAAFFLPLNWIPNDVIYTFKLDSKWRHLTFKLDSKWRHPYHREMKIWIECNMHVEIEAKYFVSYQMCGIVLVVYEFSKQFRAKSSQCLKVYSKMLTYFLNKNYTL